MCVSVVIWLHYKEVNKSDTNIDFEVITTHAQPAGEPIYSRPILINKAQILSIKL